MHSYQYDDYNYDPYWDPANENSLDLTTDIKEDPYPSFSQPSQSSPYNRPPDRGAPMGRGRGIRSRGTDRPSTPARGRANSSKGAGRGLSFSQEEIQTLLYSIYLAESPPQLLKRYEVAHGTERSKAGIKQKSMSLCSELLRSIVQKEPTEPQIDPSPMKAYQFLGPHLMKDDDKLKVYFAVYKCNFKAVRVGFDKALGAVKFVLTKLNPDESPFDNVDAKNEVILTYPIPPDYEIVAAFDHDDIKGVEVVASLGFQSKKNSLDDMF